MEGKLEMLAVIGELMPAGKPDFLNVISYPKIADIVIKQGAAQMMLILSVMVRDFCSTMNVQRNMNQDQILEAAAMLLAECDNFRLEDYAMMFTMAKKGELVKIYERIDLQVITDMLDAYWTKRKWAADNASTAEANNLESLGPTFRSLDNENPENTKLSNKLANFGAAIHIPVEDRKKLK